MPMDAGWIRRGIRRVIDRLVEVEPLRLTRTIPADVDPTDLGRAVEALAVFSRTGTAAMPATEMRTLLEGAVRVMAWLMDEDPRVTASRMMPMTVPSDPESRARRLPTVSAPVVAAAISGHPVNRDLLAGYVCRMLPIMTAMAADAGIDDSFLASGAAVRSNSRPSNPDAAIDAMVRQWRDGPNGAVDPRTRRDADEACRRWTQPTSGREAASMDPSDAASRSADVAEDVGRGLRARHMAAIDRMTGTVHPTRRVSGAAA